MRKSRKSLGFTMAEMLIVVAIIAVLGGVVFIAVQNHQRSMAQLERNTIAKELFIAAQNHLTMAESEGYPVEAVDDDFFGTAASDETEEKGSVDEPATPSGEGSPTADTGKKPTDVYYVIGPGSGNILDLMLPFGSIDETVRAGGSYLIRYQTNPAMVLDVFYVTTSGSPERFNKSGGIEAGDYDELMGYKDNLPTSGYVLGYYGGEEALQSGEIILAPTVEIHNEERLTVTVTDNNINNTVAALKLIIAGETSGAKLAVSLTPTILSSSNGRFSSTTETNSIVYSVVLDDITVASAASPYDAKINDGLHFADLNAFADPNAFAGSEVKVLQFWQNEKEETPTFLPGENITVQAVAYSNTALTNIAYSSARTTNSLFADPGEVSTTAMIANFRHLENLDANISNLDKTLGFTGAEQIADMIWKDTDTTTRDFVNAIMVDKSVEEVKIYRMDDSTGGGADCSLPVTPSVWGKADGETEDGVEPSILSYEGNGHAITGVTVNGTGDAGLFGALISGSSVANLKLVDFSVETSEGNAGALVGKLAQKTSLGDDEYNVSNVVAYNTSNGADATIKTASGSAGGLIGQIVGEEATDATDTTNSTDKTAKAVIQKSAAALIVSATGGNAGGLIGTTAGGTVSGCYAGGHTIDDPNGTGAVVYDDSSNDKYNVSASGIAGGLIGDAGATTISYSYSTCSATGATVGGLIGTGSGAITYSYCTGKVSGTTQGAFAGDWKYSGQTKDDINGFFEIVNEFTDPTIGYDYLTPVPKDKTSDGKGKPLGITAIDGTAQSYNDFCGAPTEWKPAIPYKEQTKLESYYGGKYNLKTVAQLTLLNPKFDPTKEIKVEDGSGNAPADFVATHYGDWPVPEIFVVNTKDTSTTPAVPTP